MDGFITGTISGGTLGQACGTPGPTIQPTQPKDKIRQVNIQQLDHGYMVTVGCQQFAIETPEKILSNLKTYFKEPAKTEKAWLEGNLKL